MYLPHEHWSDGPRQGDVVAGRVLLPPACRVSDVKKLEENLQADRQFKLQLDVVIRSCQFLVMSQCCDLDDARILVCSIAPMRGKVRLDKLTDPQRDSFLKNEVPEDQGAEVVMPGMFYLQGAEGVFEGDHVAEFNAVRVFKKTDFAALEKVAELTLEARHQLRLKLATYFSRVPDDDMSVLSTADSDEADEADDSSPDAADSVAEPPQTEAGPAVPLTSPGLETALEEPTDASNGEFTANAPGGEKVTEAPENEADAPAQRETADDKER